MISEAENNTTTYKLGSGLAKQWMISEAENKITTTNNISTNIAACL